MNLKSFIRNFILKETQDLYQGEHEAPSRHDGDASCPIWQMDKLFGEDVYSPNAAKYFGDGLPYDNQAIYIIKACRNKPKSFLTIYRAVPDLDFEIKQKIKPLVDLLNYHLKYGFLPIAYKRTKEQNQIIHYLEDEKYMDIENYDEKQNAILTDIRQQVENLSSQKSKPLKINPGDWITTIKEYAIEHGKDNLNGKYKIISKKVKASEVYSEGNSIYEFGYSPENSQSLTESLNKKKYITVFHGTQPKFVEQIKKEGLVDKTGNYSQGWYMLSTGFNSALFHANPDDNQKENVFVFEFKIPYDDSNYWVGYPYLWKGQNMNEDGTQWFALMKPIPSKFITRIITVPYQNWIQQKQKGLY